MTLEELDKLEIDVIHGLGETNKNILEYFGNDLKTLGDRKEISMLASEIFKNSLRIIQEERARINKSLQGDL